MKQWILIVICSFTALAVVLPKSKDPQWQYYTDTIPTTGRLIACPDADYLDRYGAQGWELADCIYQTYQNSNDTWSTAVVVIFKRPR